jgi:GAF domain-containing protein/CheY-like chemotaxis protein
MDQRTRELELLAESSRLLTATLDVDEVVGRLAEIALSRLGVDVVRIWMREPGGDAVVLRAQKGQTRQPPGGQPALAPGEGVAGWVLNQRQPLVVPDLQADARVKLRDWSRAEGLVSALVVPIVLEGTAIGMLAAMSRRPREFSPADVALAEALSAPAALAFRNASVYAEALDRLEEIEAFQRLATETLSSPDLETALRAVVRETQELLDADAAFCSLGEPGPGDAETVVSVGARAWAVPRTRLTAAAGLTALLSRERRPVRTDDYLGDPRFGRTPEGEAWAREEGIATAIAAPVVSPRGEALALLWAFNRKPRPFTVNHERRLARLSQQAALAIGKARSLQEERQRATETAALLEIARASTSSLDLRPLLAEVARRSAQALGVERCTISLWQGERLVPMAAQFADGHLSVDLWDRLKRSDREGGFDRVAAIEEAARTKQPVAVDDATQSPLVPQAWMDHFGTRAVLVAPLVVKDQVIGVMVLGDSRGPRAWTTDQVGLATTIAAHVALAVDRAQNYAEAEHRANEVQTLAEVGETLTSTLELPELLDAVADSAIRLVGGHRAAVFELDPGDGRLHARAVRGPGLSVGITLEVGQGTSGIAVASRQVAWCRDNLTAPPEGYDRPVASAGTTLAEVARRLGYRAVLSVPMLSRETALGAVSIYWDEPHEPDPREIRLLSALARQAAIAMENARLVRDLRRTLEDLQAAQDTLVRGATLRAVGELAAGAAHHLNNLLAVVLGRTQLLLMRDPSPAMAQSLRTIERAAVDAAETVRRIQAFSTTDRGAEAAELDLNDVVQEAMQLTRSRWEHEAQLKGTRIDVGFEPATLPRMVGRSAELREAVANILLNAVDAMPGGGRIRIVTRADSGRVVVTVSDTGVGMTEEVRRRAFEPFFTTKGVKSTGLGLPVAYGAIRRHGGEIAVESTPGQGTTVTFWLPAPALPAGTARAGVAPAAPVQGAVLVIDDEASVRELVTDVLSLQGHSVSAAADGAAGVALFRQGRFDLVITDLGMPGMNGWEVARAIRALAPTTPILLLTGWRDVVQPPEGARVDGVLTKPFDVDALSASISQLLRSSRS